MNVFMLQVRSIIFYIGFSIITILVATNGVLIGWLLPFRWRTKMIAHVFGLLSIFWLRVCCGIKFEVEGVENIPDEPCIIASKHQSSWETYFLQSYFTPVVTILKKELLYIPFFGWGLRMVNQIAIDRKDGRSSIEQLVEQGTNRLKDNIWVLLFPEGTRIDIGKSKPYAKGGSVLAHESGYGILPMAHNAGLFWPAHQLIKYPGTVKVVFGPVIQPAGKEVPDITKEIEEWTETKTNELVDEGRKSHPHLPAV